MLKINRTTTDAFLKMVILGLILGLFFSNALKSISIVILSVGFILYENPASQLKNIIGHKLYLSAILITVLYIMSGLLGGDLAFYIESVKDKLLYFTVPLTLSLVSCKKNEKTGMLLFFICCAVFQSLYAITYLLFDKTILNTYNSGNVLPVLKIHHVQIATLIAISIVLAVSVIFTVTQKWLKIIVAITACWLYIFLHIFAVRTGLLLLYGMLLLYIISYFTVQKKWIHLSGFIALILLSGVIMVQHTESLKNKINYMKYDLLLYKLHNTNLSAYSDSRRLQSIETGVQLLKNHPLTGCGIGNLKKETARIYKQKNENIPAEFYYLPHSQYIYFLSCFGWIAGVLLICCFIYPFVYFIREKEYLYSSVYSGLILLGIWDAFLGTLFGNCLYIVIIGLGINKHEESTARKY